jgi:phage-related minor tail protein
MEDISLSPEQIQQAIEGLLITTERTTAAVDKLTKDIEEQRQESKDLGSRFGYYQQSTQSVINLAFSLIASATISVFITVVLKH